MKQTTFQAALRMVAHAAGKRDARYYLNGVSMEATADGLYLIATDGYRLAVAKIEGQFTPGQVTIGNDAVKQILAAPKSTGIADIALEAEQAVITMAGQVFKFGALGGKYPDWRRVVGGIPEPTECIGVNAEYLAQAASALAKVANRKYQGLKMHLRGTNNSIRLEAGLAGDFEGLAEAYCIVMPMRL